MGKVSTAATTEVVVMTKKKGKGRRSNTSLSISTLPNHRNHDSPIITYTRSAHRNPSIFNSPPPDFVFDDDERKQTKVKLVVRLPQSEDTKNRVADDYQRHTNKRHSRDYDSASGSGSGSDSDPESRDRAAARRSDGAAPIQLQEKNVVKGTGTPLLHGSTLEPGPRALLPDKKLLVFILDRLQKKDTYRVFSEPVDIDELPDYFEIIEQPMDFGTVRKKLDGGAYKSLEALEADVFLICSNAMKYNAPETVYYRQARTIQEIAKRDFENLRHEGANGEPQPKVVRRGRPPGNKNQKKLLETSSQVDHAVTELSPGAAGGSNSYNLRKAPPLNRYRSSDMFVSSYRSRNGENYSEWLADWNDEFPAKILRADMKHGNKHFTVDVNRRETYRQFHPSDNLSAVSNSSGETKLLVPVGLHEPLAYARSVARFAASLGPVAWKVASGKIESALPGGIQYGPGWVGQENEAPHLQPLSFSTEKQRSSNSSLAGDFCNSKIPGATPSAWDINSAFALPNNSQSQLLGLQGGDAPYMKTPFPIIVQQKQQPVYESQRNGFGGAFGYGTSAQEGALPSETVGGSFGQNEAKVHENWNVASIGEGETWPFENSSWPAQQIQSINNNHMGPPDLNMRVPVGSPGSSSLQIGLPRQPDLALQL